MPIFEITLSVKQNGVEVFGSPMRRRLEVEESTGVVEYEKTVGTYTALPTSVLDEINVLLVRTSKPVTIRLDAQSDAGIDLLAGGVLLIFDGDIDAGAATNATVSNVGADTAVLKVLAGGT